MYDKYNKLIHLLDRVLYNLSVCLSYLSSEYVYSALVCPHQILWVIYNNRKEISKIMQP